MTYADNFRNANANWHNSRTSSAKPARKSTSNVSKTLSGMSHEDSRAAFNTIVQLSLDIGRKFELIDVEGDNECLAAADEYLTMYAAAIATGVRRNFDYLDQMLDVRARYRDLSWGQVKGVLNCLRADAVREATRQQPTTTFCEFHQREEVGACWKNPNRATAQPSAPSESVTDGMYRDPQSETIYKVQYNKAQGDGRRAYAKRLIVEDGNVRFEYTSGAMRFIRPEWRMTLEDAKAFGALYGSCCVCGRTLTDENSIADGIGPVCAGKL